MNHEDNIPALVGAISNAIGYTTGPTFLEIFREEESNGESDLIAPSILETNKDGQFWPTAHGYVVPNIGRGAIQIPDTRPVYVPPFDVKASSDAFRISTWPRDHDEQSEIHRVEAAKRLLASIRQSLWQSQQKLAVSVLTKIATEQKNVVSWNEEKTRIYALLLKRTGWRLVLPLAHPHITSHLKGMIGHIPVESAHVDKGMGFLCGPKSDLGVWRKQSCVVPVSAWADSKDFTFGISACLLRGMAIFDYRLIKGIDLSGEILEI